VRSGEIMLCHDAERNPRQLPPPRSPLYPGFASASLPPHPRRFRSPVLVAGGVR
jgi:hypothetical protein